MSGSGLKLTESIKAASSNLDRADVISLNRVGVSVMNDLCVMRDLQPHLSVRNISGESKLGRLLNVLKADGIHQLRYPQRIQVTLVTLVTLVTGSINCGLTDDVNLHP